MGFVHHQDVEAARVSGLFGQHFAEQAQGCIAFDKVDGGDQAREVRPRVGVNPPAAAQLFHQGAVHNSKIQPEFIVHLIAPVVLQPRRADDQRRPRPVTHDQFLDDQPGFHRFAQAHIIGN